MSVCNIEGQGSANTAEDLETDRGYGSRDSPNCLLISTQDGENCTRGEFPEQDDLPTMIHYGTTWMSPSGSQTEDLLFHFGISFS